jgi:hypothetical protein
VKVYSGRNYLKINNSKPQKQIKYASNYFFSAKIRKKSNFILEIAKKKVFLHLNKKIAYLHLWKYPIVYAMLRFIIN